MLTFDSVLHNFTPLLCASWKCKHHPSVVSELSNPIAEFLINGGTVVEQTVIEYPFPDSVVVMSSVLRRPHPQEQHVYQTRVGTYHGPTDIVALRPYVMQIEPAGSSQATAVSIRRAVRSNGDETATCLQGENVVLGRVLPATPNHHHLGTRHFLPRPENLCSQHQSGLQATSCPDRCLKHVASLKQWAALQGVSYQTARRWRARGILPVETRKVGRLILVDVPPVDEGSGGVAVYGRVSSSDQKGDLDPSPAQVGAICRHFGARRFLYEWCVTELRAGMERFRETGERGGAQGSEFFHQVES